MKIVRLDLKKSNLFKDFTKDKLERRNIIDVVDPSWTGWDKALMG